MITEEQTEEILRDMYRPLTVGDRIHMPEFDDGGRRVLIYGTIVRVLGPASEVEWDVLPPNNDSVLVELYETVDLVELRVSA